jgi:hypothetical protein
LDEGREQASVLLVGPPLSLQLLTQSADRFFLGLKQSFTIYLSFTSTLWPTFIHPYKDAAVLPIGTERTSHSTLSHGLGAGA